MGATKSESLTLPRAAERVAELLGHKPVPSTIWRWATIGIRGIRLQFVRCGGRVFIRPCDLESFLVSIGNTDRVAAERQRLDAAMDRHREDAERQLDRHRAAIAGEVARHK